MESKMNEMGLYITNNILKGMKEWFTFMAQKLKDSNELQHDRPVPMRDLDRLPSLATGSQQTQEQIAPVQDKYAGQNTDYDRILQRISSLPPGQAHIPPAGLMTTQDSSKMEHHKLTHSTITR